MNGLLVFLGILKVIGLVVAALVSLFLFVVALVLFIPFTYNITGDIAGGVQGTGHITWLFGIFQLHHCYGNDGESTTLKFLFIPIKQTKENPTQKQQTKKQANKKNDSPKQAKKTIAHSTEEPESNDENNTSKTLKQLYNQYQVVLQSKGIKKILALTFVFLRKLWKALKPKQFCLGGEVGFLEPSTTGLFCGGLGLLVGLSGLDIQIQGNFQKQVTNVQVHMAGRLMLFSIVWALLTYVVKKPIWQLIKPYITGKEDAA